MKIVSTTLTGNNEDVIGDAIRSVVDWVDTCLVIDTGVTDRSLEIARDIARNKFAVVVFPWRHDFAAARNFALQMAVDEVNATWCLTLDTDERIDLRNEDIRRHLAVTTADVVLMTHDSETYNKERCFRASTPGAWVGPTHEYFPLLSPRQTFQQARFTEVAKTPEQYQHKFGRDVSILRDHTRRHPKDPRWHFYLGESFKNLQRYSEAIQAYLTCANLRGWNEESAWACYRAAECHCILERWSEAIDVCAKGLARHAGLGELAWLASYAAWKAGWLDQAVWWARLSIGMGKFRGCGMDVKRNGFSNPCALYEGPYDVLRYALRALGEEAGADEAETLYHDAVQARTGATL